MKRKIAISVICCLMFVSCFSGCTKTEPDNSSSDDRQVLETLESGRRWRNDKEYARPLYPDLDKEN